jgi:hypothetical protein
VTLVLGRTLKIIDRSWGLSADFYHTDDLLESGGLWHLRVSLYTPMLENGHKNLAIIQHRIIKSIFEDSEEEADLG